MLVGQASIEWTGCQEGKREAGKGHFEWWEGFPEHGSGLGEGRMGCGNAG